MKGTLIESANPSSAKGGTSLHGRSLIAAICAVLITGLIFVGYAYLRKRHTQQIAASAPLAPPASAQPKGPPKAEILVDEATLERDQTVIGGTVKNISSEDLSGLSLNLELKRRKDGTTQRTAVQVNPAQLAPQQEGHYSLRLRSADYSSARLVGLAANSGLLAYATSPGKKRPPEKLEGKTIIVSRPGPAKGEFINTPDTPVRVP